MKISRQQFIAVNCVLLLQLGLFASLVHAAQHPFHVQDELCASFIHFAKNDLSADLSSAVININLYMIETTAENQQSFITSFQPVYFSRAPPVS